MKSHCIEVLSPVTFLERSAQVYGSKTAIKCDTRLITYREMLDHSRRMADLLNSLGVGRGDNVCLLSLNSEYVLEAHFAVPASGGVLVCLNPWLTLEEMLHQVRFSNARVIMVSTELYKKLPELFAEIKDYCEVILLGAEPHPVNNGTVHFDQVKSGCNGNVPLDNQLESEHDTIAINFTSGTTGTPKGVMYSHRAAYLHALGQVMMFGLRPDSRHLWTVPMFHVNGWGHMWAAVAIGATQYVDSAVNRSEWDQVIELMKCNHISHLAGAPRLLSNLENADRDGLALCGSILMTGGAAPTPDLSRRLSRKGARLIHQYGLSETCGPFVVCEDQPGWNALDQEQRLQKQLRQGVPSIHAGTGVRVVDSDGYDVPQDGKSLGEVIMRGNTLACGYYKNVNATRKSFRDGWFHSGDMAVVHADGYLEIKDRIKDLIFVNTDYGWENISTIEIEQVASGVSGIQDVAVVGVADEDENDTVIFTFYEKQPGSRVQAEEIKARCRQYLPQYMVPHHYLENSIPKTATGKVRKNQLEEVARAYLSASIMAKAQ